MFDDGAFLNGQYTVIGEVVSGMDVVDKIKKGEGGQRSVSKPDKIVKMRLASDARCGRLVDSLRSFLLDGERGHCEAMT